ncbi:hypothetical protein [Variovorax sp. OV084]|uniref:hypothetical protein n=1 Tax=Variovorax sp. OV084 TaxID=1882777 RepID=UPI0008C8D357|nr:hypothetical protein [Variovorax sp. OV084]SET36751.1 hypothetical protein SAMN05443580_10391 [Variovorax sp. OV084]
MTTNSPLKIRKAVQVDLPAITAMLADDVLGAARERPGDAALYETAWRQNKRRTDAYRFYERLGFEATHEGMKLELAAA